jgi:hypothetical protein
LLLVVFNGSFKIMELKDTLEIEETTGGFQPSVEDSFLLNEMDKYPGDSSRFFVGMTNDNSIEPSTEDVDIFEENPLEKTAENPVISYQNDISLEDEFDLSSIPTNKPSDFGYDDGRPSSTPFNEDDTDGAMFDISTIDDFIHSNDQNPTPIVDNTPALEPIRIQLDTPILSEEPPAKKVKPPKVKKPSKPIDRKVAIIFTMLISSMMVTMSILFLLWKQKQAKEELYAMKASVLNHTSPNGKSSALDSIYSTNTHSTSTHSQTTTIATHLTSDSASHQLGKSTDSSVHSAINKTDSTSIKHQSNKPTTNVAHSSSSNNHHSTHTTNTNTLKKSAVHNRKDSDLNTLKSNNRTTVSSKTTRVPEYALKVHSSYSKVDAYSKAEQLRKEGIENVTVTEQKIRDRTLYNVRYGKFSTLNEAESASQRTTLPSKWIDRTK